MTGRRRRATTPSRCWERGQLLRTAPHGTGDRGRQEPLPARQPRPLRAGAALGRSAARGGGGAGPLPRPVSLLAAGRCRLPSLVPSGCPAARRLAASPHPPPAPPAFPRLADGGANVPGGLFPGRGARAAATWGTARSQGGQGGQSTRRSRQRRAAEGGRQGRQREGEGEGRPWGGSGGRGGTS